MSEYTIYGYGRVSQPVLVPPAGCHWAYAEGYGAGLRNERSHRGFMLFGSGFGDAETKANVRQWVNGFCDAQIAKDGAESFETYRNGFVAEVVGRGVWTAEEVWPELRIGIIDSWCDRLPFAQAVDKYVRETRN